MPATEAAAHASVLHGVFSEKPQVPDGTDKPQFTLLLDALYSRGITEDVVSRPVARHFREVEARFQHARLAMLRNLALWRLATDVVRHAAVDRAQARHSLDAAHASEAAAAPTAAQTAAAVAPFSLVLGMAEAGQMHGGTAAGSSVQARRATLSQHLTDHARATARSAVVTGMTRAAASALERLAMANDANASAVPTGAGERMYHAMLTVQGDSLPHTMADVRSEAARARRRATIALRRNDRARAHLGRLLLAEARLLKQFVEQYQLGVHARVDEAHSYWLTARCKAMVLKLRVLTQQVRVDTYSASACRALSTVHAHVERKRSEVDAETRQVSARLSMYDGVSSDFAQLVSRYTLLQREIKEKRWALRELAA